MSKPFKDAYCDKFSAAGDSIEGVIRFEGKERPQFVIEVLHTQRVGFQLGHDVVPSSLYRHTDRCRFKIDLEHKASPIDLLTRRVDVRMTVSSLSYALRLSESLVNSLIQQQNAGPRGEAVVLAFSPGEFPLHRTVQAFSGQFAAVPVTELCDLIRKHGSDKCSARHTYTPLYDALFAPLRAKPVLMLEVGLGTNHPDVPSNMGPDGQPGASVRAFRDYFAKGQIFGADVDDRILFEETRIKTLQVDQTDAQSVRAMWEKLPKQPFDIILDDGLHEYEANKLLFDESFKKLKQGGYYIVEDIVGSLANLRRFQEWIANAGAPAVMVDMPAKENAIDNRVAIFQKP